MSPLSHIWHNGTFVKDGPVFSVNDRVRLGDGVFDTMLAVDGKTVRADEHFERLIRHAGVLSIPVTISVRELEETAEKLLFQNDFKTGRFVINTVITRGPAERGLKIPEKQEPSIVMKAAKAPEIFPAIEAVIVNVRKNEGSPLSRIKSCNYGDHILALAEAGKAGANEAILLNNRGHVACASGSNVFVMRGGKLLTPPLADGAMDGIIRAKMIRELGAKEETLTPADLAEGVYLTNSVRGVMAVQKLNGKALPAPSLQIAKDFHLS